MAIARIVGQLAQDARQGKEILMFLPAVGTIFKSNTIVALQFLDYLRTATRNIHKLPFRDRLQRLHKTILPEQSTLPKIKSMSDIKEESKISYALGKKE